VPGEAYDSAFPPLAANPPQNGHHSGRRENRDMTKGMAGWRVGRTCESIGTRSAQHVGMAARHPA